MTPLIEAERRKKALIQARKKWPNLQTERIIK